MPDPNVRFVQFPHPGGQHYADRDGGKAWNPASRQHARKFLELDGEWLLDGERGGGALWAWGEWEPESDLIHTFEPDDDRLPWCLWKPYFLAKNEFEGLHNTDPFIFDGFYYSNCKQGTSSSLEGLKHLGPGSVIVFGSSKRGEWVVDTVLVIRDFIDYTFDDYESVLRDRVPDAYWQVTLGPTFSSEWSRQQTFRLYRGATYDDPYEGMFSFFPCVPAIENRAFPRPILDLPSEHFNPKLLQGAKGHAMTGPTLEIGEVKALWSAICTQVEEQNSALGISAAAPPLRV